MYILSPRICNGLVFLFTFVTNSCCILAKAKQHVYPVASVPTSPAFHHNPRHGKHFPSQSQENIRRPPSEDGKIYLPPSYRSQNVKKSKSLGYRNLKISFVLFLATFNTLILGDVFIQKMSTVQDDQLIQINSSNQLYAHFQLFNPSL